MIELAINEETTINNICIKCVKDTDTKLGCDFCAFNGTFICMDINIKCMGHRRKDNTNVHFERVKLTQTM